MKQIILGFIAGSCLLITTSCNTNSTAQFEEQIDAAKTAYSTSKTGMPDNTTIKALISAYENYVKNAPNDEKSAEYLFNAGQLYQQTKEFKTATATFEEVYTKYGQSSKAPNALFLMAMSYRDQLQDTAKAKKYYTEFLQKYPNHELADDAQLLLQNIGKTDEELFQEIISKAAAKGDTNAMTIQKQQQSSKANKK